MRSRWCAGCSKRRTVSGIFNVGTGKARSFRDLITAMFAALGQRAEHRIFDMPDAIRDSYQYFTQAEVENLRRAGYNAGFTPLEDAVRRYVTQFLDRDRPVSLRHVRFRKTSVRASRQQTILCVGDLMLDDFVYGEVSRISPEAPAPVLAVKRNEVTIGGAGNVARNIASLGARCIFVGVVGDDEAGPRRHCAAAGRTADRALSGGRSRAADDAQGALRLRALLDPSAARRLGAGRRRSTREREGELIARALAALPRVGAVVLSDYAKGVLTPRVIRAVIDGGERGSASRSSSIRRRRTMRSIAARP